MKAKFIKHEINENTHETFKYGNFDHEKIEKAKNWVRNNPELARRKESDLDSFDIEVFSNFNHKQVADDLQRALEESGFLHKYPLFSIKIQTI